MNLCVANIARQLQRSTTSVVLKLKRLGLSRRFREGYTLSDLELCFGADHHLIDSWIRRGWLAGVRRYGSGSSRDAWVLSDADVRRFIREHPLAFDLRRVDQTWFLDLILAGGLLREESVATVRRRIAGPLFAEAPA